MRFSDVRKHVFPAALVIFIILALVASYAGSYPDRLGARAHIDLTQVAYTPTFFTIFPIYVYVTTTTTTTTTVFSTSWRSVTEISFITSTTRESIYLTETRVIPPPIFSVNPTGWGTSALAASILGAAAACVCFTTVLRRRLCSGFWKTWRPPHLDTSVVDLRDKKEPLIPRIPEGEPKPIEPPPAKEPEPVKEPPREAPPKEEPRPIQGPPSPPEEKPELGSAEDFQEAGLEKPPPVEPPKICPRCHRPLPIDASFCNRCGEQVVFPVAFEDIKEFYEGRKKR